MQELELSAIMSKHSSYNAVSNQPAGLRKMETQSSAIAQLLNALLLNGDGRRSERADSAAMRVEENKAEPEAEIQA